MWEAEPLDPRMTRTRVLRTEGHSVNWNIVRVSELHTLKPPQNCKSPGSEPVLTSLLEVLSVGTGRWR